MSENKKVRPGFRTGTVLTDDGRQITPPEDWIFLPAGDGPLTREVKKRGPSWQVLVKRGRREISKGIWAPEGNVAIARTELTKKRGSVQYQQKRATDLQRRQKKQEQYVEDFYQETLKFLNFHPVHAELGKTLAHAVTSLATPVGSGTVARTQRIPLSKRVEAAVIAWLRHNTTGYDTMYIPRIRGKRREVRRNLAQRSLALVERYRLGEITGQDCPLVQALKKVRATNEQVAR